MKSIAAETNGNLLQIIRAYKNLGSLAETERQANYLIAILGTDKGISATVRRLPRGAGHRVLAANGKAVDFLKGPK